MLTEQGERGSLRRIWDGQGTGLFEADERDEGRGRDAGVSISCTVDVTLT
jgi:hypothetical protein